MVLVDTSVWVSHLREMRTDLAGLLNDGEVACHPFIVGELACGNLKNRTIILSLLEALPMVFAAEHDEVLTFIENHSLMGKGLGYIGVHPCLCRFIATAHLDTRQEIGKGCRSAPCSIPDQITNRSTHPAQAQAGELFVRPKRIVKRFKKGI